MTAPTLPPLPPQQSNLLPDDLEPEVAPVVSNARSTVKPGWQTTEFWLAAVMSVLVAGGALLMFLTSTITQSAFVVLSVAGGVALPMSYVLCRGALKAWSVAHDVIDVVRSREPIRLPDFDEVTEL